MTIDLSKIVLFDTETTDASPEARLVQIAHCQPFGDKEHGQLIVMKSGFFKPPVPISFDAMAVHHITNDSVEGKEAFIASSMWAELKALADAGCLFVAHNTAFDIQVLKNEGIEVPNFLDTYKLAVTLIPEEMNHYSLQYLRYALKINQGPHKIPEVDAHDAVGDVWVLFQLFSYLIETYQPTMERMIEISRMPLMLKRLPFGKHKGKTFAEVASTDRSYLSWLYMQDGLDENLNYTLMKWLKN